MNGPIYNRDNPRPCSFAGDGTRGNYNCRCCPERCNPGNGYCCGDCRYQPNMDATRREEDEACAKIRSTSDVDTFDNEQTAGMVLIEKYCSALIYTPERGERACLRPSSAHNGNALGHEFYDAQHCPNCGSIDCCLAPELRASTKARPNDNKATLSAPWASLKDGREYICHKPIPGNEHFSQLALDVLRAQAYQDGRSDATAEIERRRRSWK